MPKHINPLAYKEAEKNIQLQSEKMTTTAEKIAVMQAFEDGKRIKCTPYDTRYYRIWWLDVTAINPLWDWKMFEYVIEEDLQKGIDNELIEIDNELMDEIWIQCRLLNLAKKLNKGWKPDWNNLTQSKYFIKLCDGEFEIIDSKVTDYLTPCFKSEKAARKAIKEIEGWD